jgi:hypothetical protein
MKLRKLFHISKKRKYPINRDKEGLSLRARCFELFDQGKRPANVAQELKMKETSVYQYFREWKRHGPNFERKYAYIKSLFIKTAPERDKNIELFAGACGIPKEQFITILSQPHGLRRLMTGKFYFTAHAEADHKRSVALELALLISDHLNNNAGKFEDVYFALQRWMDENKKCREEEDAAIKEENTIMAFVRKLLAADMENERKGRVRPDKLSEEEREAIIRLGVEAEMEKAEIWYWFRIGSLKAEGLTPEQAREKIYQDLLKRGDLKRAKLFREFQDKVHPLKAGGQSPPAISPQPPPAP